MRLTIAIASEPRLLLNHCTMAVKTGSSITFLWTCWEQLSETNIETIDFHTNEISRVALLLPSITVMLLLRKLKFLARLMVGQSNTLNPITFQTLPSIDVYDISLVQQCIMVENQFGTNITLGCLTDPVNTEKVSTTYCR